LKSTLAIALALSFLLATQALAVRTLNGRLVLENERGDLAAASGIGVAREGSSTRVLTNDEGLFRVALDERDKPGKTIRLRVEKNGWVIHRPLNGRVPVPARPGGLVVVRLLPKGAEGLWTDERIEDLIEELAYRSRRSTTPEDALGGMDFSGPIRDWGERHGFAPEEVRARIDRWVTDTEQTEKDPRKLGLAAFARKEPRAAERLLAESAQTKALGLEQIRRNEPKPADDDAVALEEAVRDFRLAGDVAYGDLRFAAALEHYRSALALLHATDRPALRAATLRNVAGASFELGLRAGDEAPVHLTRAADALRAALEVQTREATPLLWVETQAMLMRVLEALGDAPGMAAVVAELIEADPDNREYYKLAHALSHEVLFDFEKSHRLTEAWLARYPDDLDALCNLAETHFTTGRFALAAEHLEALVQSGALAAEQDAAMRLLQVANLLARGWTLDVRERLADLQALIEAQPSDFSVGWAFEGSSHFVGEHPALEAHRGALFGLFWAAETGKRDTLLMAIDKARGELSSKQ
jgi:tetratricopeptide (TPR) repeat protein